MPSVETFQGELLWPEDPSYDSARRLWNRSIDRRPALIGRATGREDVVALVRHARRHGLPLSVRAGGHGVAGHAVCDGGVVVDLGSLRGVAVVGGSAVVQPGATWGDLDGETHRHGLATTGGLISTTGVAGLVLGGGIGWLMRRHGLACDNLVAAEVVDAEGRVRTTDEDPDLLWALRGGGGNFGVVTRFVLRLHEVQDVVGGQLLFPLARAGEVARAYRALAASASDDLTTVLAFLTAPPAPFVPEALRGRKIVAVVACHLGDAAAAERELAPLRALIPALDTVGPMPYVALQRMLDAGAPPGLGHHWKAEYLAGLDDAALDALAAAAAALPTPLSQIHVHHLEGAVARVPDDATAFGHRGAGFALNVLGTWEDERDGAASAAWARATAAALAGAATGGVYVNFLGEEDQHRVASAHGARNFERLRELKRRYDPENFFRGNANIPPAR
jgi:FAD/FMN-containing dehydrogenase